MAYHVPDYDNDDERNGSLPDGRREEEDEEGGFGGGPREYPPRDTRQLQFVLPRVQVPIGPPLRSFFSNRFDVSPSRLDVIPPPLLVSSTLSMNQLPVPPVPSM